MKNKITGIYYAVGLGIIEVVYVDGCYEFNFGTFDVSISMSRNEMKEYLEEYHYEKLGDL